MTKEVQELLPVIAEDDPRRLSEYYNPHEAELSEVAPVEIMPSLAETPPALKEAITSERRKRAGDDSKNLSVILGLNETLEKARIDPVTGLRNRHAFESEVPVIFERAEAGEVTFLDFDLNGLKRANNLGHEVGDKYLKQVASSILASLRPTDIVYRSGGDELVAVLGGSIEESILGELGNRIKSAVNRDLEPLGLSPDLYLGVSVGGAVKQIDETLEDCRRRSDMSCEADKKAFYAKIEQETGKAIRR